MEQFHSLPCTSTLMHWFQYRKWRLGDTDTCKAYTHICQLKLKFRLCVRIPKQCTDFTWYTSMIQVLCKWVSTQNVTKFHISCTLYASIVLTMDWKLHSYFSILWSDCNVMNLPCNLNTWLSTKQTLTEFLSMLGGSLVTRTCG
jgi:hypothetical protein